MSITLLFGSTLKVELPSLSNNNVLCYFVTVPEDFVKKLIENTNNEQDDLFSLLRGCAPHDPTASIISPYTLALHTPVKTATHTPVKTATSVLGELSAEDKLCEEFSKVCTPSKEKLPSSDAAQKHFNMDCDDIGLLDWSESPSKREDEPIVLNKRRKLDSTITTTCFVKVINLPDTYTEGHFMKKLTKLTQCHQLTLIDFNEEDKTVVIQCPDSVQAKRIAEFKTLKYDEQTLKLVLFFRTVLDETMLAQEETCFLQFCNVPDTYDEPHFKKVLKKALTSKMQLPSYEDVCVDWDEIEFLEWKVDEGTLLVECPDCRQAQFIADLKTMTYDDERVRVSLFFKSKSKVDNPQQEVQSCVIEFRDVPDTYEEIHFRNILKKRVTQKTSDHEQISIDWEKLVFIEWNEEECTLLVECPHHAQAQFIANLKTMEYDDEIVKVALYTPSCVTKVAPKVAKSLEPLSPELGYNTFGAHLLSSTQYGDWGHRTEPQQSESTLTEPQLDEPIPIQSNNTSDESETEDGEVALPLGVRYRNDWPHFETLTLIKACLLYRDLLKSRRTQQQGEGWSKVVKYMWKAKLYFSKKNIKKKMGLLVLSYSQEGPTWLYHSFLAEYAGDSDKGSSKIEDAIAKCERQPATDSDPFTKKKKTLNALNKYMCGCILVMDGTIPIDVKDKFKNETLSLLLIAEYKKRKQLFDDDKHRADGLYRDIRDAFHSLGYSNITTEDCSNRMAYLANEFKRRYDMLRLCTGTGPDPMNWAFYDAMGQLFESSVVLEPQKIINLGSSSSLQIWGEEMNHHKRTGRKRVEKRDQDHSHTSKKVSYKDAKLDIGNRMVDQLGSIVEMIHSRGDK